jgi:DNA-binding CsgD family transcriptional regulator
MLGDGGPIQSAHGNLQAKAPSGASELRSAHAAPNEAGIHKNGLAVRLSEPDVPSSSLMSCRSPGATSVRSLQPAAVAAVLIGAPPDDQDGKDAVAATFDLTPAETRAHASPFAGARWPAAGFGIAATTAKKHLEHIFLKTGAARQAELMRLWTGLICPTNM